MHINWIESLGTQTYWYLNDLKNMVLIFLILTPFETDGAFIEAKEIHFRLHQL